MPPNRPCFHCDAKRRRIAELEAENERLKKELKDRSELLQNVAEVAALGTKRIVSLESSLAEAVGALERLKPFHQGAKSEAGRIIVEALASLKREGGK